MLVTEIIENNLIFITCNTRDPVVGEVEGLYVGNVVEGEELGQLVVGHVQAGEVLEDEVGLLAMSNI